MNSLLDSPRRRRFYAAAVAALIVIISAGLALAQSPKAVLSIADMGTFNVIRTDGSDGKTLDLFAVPESAQFLKFNDYTLGPDGKPMLRPIGILPKGASCTIILIAADCQGDTMLMARETLTVGSSPNPPGPGPGPNPPGPGPGPSPSLNPYPQPSESQIPALQPLLTHRLERSDATRLAELYGSASASVRADGAAMNTVQLRQYLVEHGKALGLSGKYPGLAGAVDRYLADTFTLDVRPLHVERSVAALDALAWAVWQCGANEP